MFFFYNSHTMISRQIINGDMDFLLTKPMSEKFLLSTMNINIGSGLSNFILGIIFIAKGARGLHYMVTFSGIVLYIILIIFGAIIYFSVSFIINLLSFWFVNAGSVFDVFMNVTDLYRYPGDIFPRVLSFCITFLIPFQMISIFPSRFLLNGNIKVVLLPEMLYALLFILLSHKVMQAAIASYTSTGS